MQTRQAQSGLCYALLTMASNVGLHLTMEVYNKVERIKPVQLAMNTTSSVFNCVGGDKGSVHALTCELQRAAQRAVSWGQQRQAGVFGVRILQTLHQGDGRVLDKLHQQL